MSEKMENNINFENDEFDEKSTTLNNLKTLEIISTTPEPIIPDESERYILIPLFVLFGILISSALVYLMARNRKLSYYCKRRKYIPKYKYDEKSDDDSDVALLRNDDVDDPTECLLKGKLEIDNRYETYQTTSKMSKDTVDELYS